MSTLTAPVTTRPWCLGRKQPCQHDAVAVRVGDDDEADRGRVHRRLVCHTGAVQLAHRCIHVLDVERDGRATYSLRLMKDLQRGLRSQLPLGEPVPWAACPDPKTRKSFPTRDTS
jgi:hypothetical protein